MRTIEAKRVDPATGHEFVFQTAPPFEWCLQRFEAPLEDIWMFIHYFYWMAWVRDYDFELDDIESEIKTIYPLVRHVVDSFWLEQQDNPDGTVGYLFITSASPSLLKREGMTKEFARTLIEEVWTSPAVLRAISWYIQLHKLASGNIPRSAFKKPVSMAIRQRRHREWIKKQIDQTSKSITICIADPSTSIN